MLWQMHFVGISVVMLTTQKQIMLDLERLEVEVILGDFQSYIASLNVQPTLIERIKNS